MTQQEIEDKVIQLQSEISFHNTQMNLREKQLLDLRKMQEDFLDPHAVIPKKYNTLQEWESDTNHKTLVSDNIFKNKSDAEKHWQLFDNIKDHFKIVKV